MSNNKPTYQELEAMLKAREDELNKLKSEKSIEKTSVFHDLFTENHSIMLIIEFETGKIINANKEACNFYGYSFDELVGMNINQINTLSEKEIKEEMLKAKKHMQNRFLFGHRLKNGEIKDVEVNSGKIILENKEYLLSFILDITERKNSEQALLRNSRILELFIKNAPAAIAMFDCEMRYLAYSACYLKDYDIEEHNIIGHSHYEVFPEIPERWKEIHRRCIAGATEHCDEDTFPRISGKTDWIRWLIIPWYDSDEKIGGIILFSEIITKRKQAEILIQEKTNEIKAINEEYKQINKELILTIERAREIESRLKLAVAAGQLGIWDWDVKDNIMNWDERMFELYGISHDIFPNNVDVWINNLHPEDKQRALDECNAALKGEKDFNTTFRIIHPDGNILWIKADGMVIRDSENNPARMIGINKDITEQYNANTAVTLSEEKFRTIFEKSKAIKIVLNADNGDIIDANPSAVEFYQYDKNKLLSMNIADINLLSREEVYKEIQIARNESKFFYKRKHRKANGDIVDVEVYNTFIKLKDMVVVYDLIIDVTERNRISNELINAKIRAEESDRLKTAFLQNVSHEIRTPMNAIMGFSELLSKNYNNKAKLDRFSQIINHRCQDLLNIINDLLDIAKIESGQYAVNIESFKLKSLLAELNIFFLESHKYSDKHNINLKFETSSIPNDIIMITDKVKLKQIFINLIDNALKFTQKGEIIIGGKFDDPDKIVFYVSDTGIGIPEDRRNLIFERFMQVETSKKINSGGTGLGLSIVKGLVNLLGGEIWLESELYKGSTFYFTISYTLSNKSEINVVSDQIYEKYDFSNRSILIVEDDIYNVEYIDEILHNTGVKLLKTPYGNEAIELSKTNQIDLILMDIRLPDINGYDAINKIKQIKPEIKIIAQTAYASHEDKQKAFDAGCIDYISKPLESDNLLSILQKYLCKNIYNSIK